MDSGEHYATATITTKWTVANGGYSVSTTQGRRNSGSVYVGDCVYKTFPSIETGAVTLGVALTVASLSYGVVTFLSGGAMQVGYCFGADGAIKVYRSHAIYNWPSIAAWLTTYGTLLGASAPGVIAINTWYYIEMQAVVSATVGSVVIHVNGVNIPLDPDLSGGDINTYSSGTAGCQSVCIANFARIDDVYAVNASGATNNDFLGDVRVDAHFPVTPDGANHDWTPLTGSDNFAMVDDPAANTTDYNSTADDENTDTFNLDHLKNAGGTILAVQALIYHAKSDAGPCYLAPIMISGATTDVGQEIVPAVTFAYATEVYDENPNGAAAWDETAFNALEVGYRKTG